MANPSSLSQSAAFALDLAKQRDGYLAPSSDVIDELRREGLVTTQNIGDGFMIVRAIMACVSRRMGFCASSRQLEKASAIHPRAQF